MDNKELIQKALDARELSYSPYSKFAVGAALLCDDETVYLGANIENASYGATVCAERSAVFKAVLDGKRKFKAIAIAGGMSDEPNLKEYAYPCGICRQVLSEFSDSSMKVIVAKSVDDYREHTLGELIPFSFEL